MQSPFCHPNISFHFEREKEGHIAPNYAPRFLSFCESLGSPVREGNGTPLQYSCLENPRDRGAWWAAIYGVAQSQTRLSDSAAVAAAVSPEASLLLIYDFCARLPNEMKLGSALPPAMPPRGRFPVLFTYLPPKNKVLNFRSSMSIPSVIIRGGYVLTSWVWEMRDQKPVALSLEQYTIDGEVPLQCDAEITPIPTLKRHDRGIWTQKCSHGVKAFLQTGPISPTQAMSIHLD